MMPRFKQKCWCCGKPVAHKHPEFSNAYRYCPYCDVLWNNNPPSYSKEDELKEMIVLYDLYGIDLPEILDFANEHALASPA